MIEEARHKGVKVDFASLDICHLKNSQLKKKHQRYKGRVVLRDDIVMDDSGSYAVLTETRFISITNDGRKKSLISFHCYPRCEGQAADASQDGRKIQNRCKLTKLKCPDMWRRLPRHKWPNHGPVWKTQSFLLKENLYGHPLAGLLWER